MTHNASVLVALAFVVACGPVGAGDPVLLDAARTDTAVAHDSHASDSGALPSDVGVPDAAMDTDDAVAVTDAGRDAMDAMAASDVPVAHDAARTDVPVAHDVAMPTDTGRCLNALPHPSSCGYPDATNTGLPAGVHLTRMNDLRIDTVGAVVENVEVTGTVTILASRVTFRNSLVHGTGYYAIHVTTYTDTPTTGVIIDHVEVDGGRHDPSVAGVVGSGYTLTHSNIHGTGDGVDVAEDTVVRDNWIHDLFVAPGDHTDGIQSAGGSPATIDHNTIDARCTGCNSAVIMGADLGDIRSITLTNNLFAGGGYQTYAGADPGHDSGTITFTGNRFTRTFVYGACSYRPSSGRTVGFTGNYWDADGAAVTGCD